MIAKDSRPILIVDDDQTTRDMLDEQLQEAGFVTLCAHDCAEAEALNQRYPVGLILLDVYLPDENGIEFCARLQSLPTMEEVPVLLISADHDTSAKVNGFQAGAADYITSVPRRRVTANGHLAALLTSYSGSRLDKVSPSPK